MEYISITNDQKVAKYFEDCGIDYIMVDLETLGKRKRQKGLNTVLSNHSITDIKKVKESLSTSKCLVRINPIHKRSRIEINGAIDNGADVLMLPFFKRKEEVENFVNLVENRADKFLLLETPQALTRVDEILAVDGIDAVHIGLNDLSIGLGLDFLYEPFIGGLVEYLALKFKSKKIKFGIGGVSKLPKGKNILSEHVRLGSSMVILNRNFRNNEETYEGITSICDLKAEIQKINKYLISLSYASENELLNTKLKFFKEIKKQMRDIL
jgi:hypothetical protein